MSKWIIVSNRLPFSYDVEKNTLRPSSGGLVTALRGVKSKQKMLWVGLLPEAQSKHLPKKNLKQSGTSMEYSVINMNKDLYDRYYNDFCNDVLWPILHYESELVKFRTESWNSYCEVNKIFAKHIAKVAKDDDVIWLHDFHLFMVPQYLKKLRPKLKVGLFLHVPFPSSEIYRQLPWREEILKSLLHSDLIGFHDFSYLRHFTSSVYHVLGIHAGLLDIKSEFNDTNLGVFPVSIDTKGFISKANSKQTQKEIQRYALGNSNLRYILGVDRLDYTKGIILKLNAYKKFLETNPGMVGKVQLIQVAIPSRTEVEEYIHLRHEVERLVSEINGAFSKLNYIPVKYIFNSVTTYELMALYRSSDVLFVTSKRDGMNLVCLEYIAAQNVDNPGVVMISEFAGAASTLSHATLINPMDRDGTAQQIGDSLKLDKRSRKKNHQIMLEYLKNYTATTWANSFMQNLVQSQITTNNRCINLNFHPLLNKIKKENQESRKILMLDYDGTLTPIVNTPSDALLGKETKDLLKKISKEKKTDIIIVSGRPSDFLEKQLKGLHCHIACEHGAQFFDRDQKRWRNLVSSNRSLWYKDALNIIQDFTRRTPNSFFEKKNYAITWHFRNSPNDFGEFQARKLVVELESGLSHLPVSVESGKKVVEVKSLEANKGYFAQWFLSRYTQAEDSVFAMGDDKTDEDLFEALEQRGLTVKVGECKSTKANYYIPDQKNVSKVLTTLFT
jgi:trehalose 6-phosphate synthase/phosphatase